MQAALGKLQERLAQLKDQEENARRQVAYDKAEAVRDELATKLADLYPAFAQKLAELLVRVVINDGEIDYINDHALPKGAARLLVAADLSAAPADPLVLVQIIDITKSNLNAVTFGSNRVVTVGVNGEILFSFDGVTWIHAGV